MYRYNVLPIFFLTLLVVSCSAFESPTHEYTAPTSTQIISPTNTPTQPDSTDAPLPSATPEPKTLTICLGAEPDTLWLYGGQMLVKSTVLEAIYDGPIDALGFDYLPVILEKLPNLADNDARIEPVSVENGNWVVNDSGEPVQLQVGEKVRPFGCNQADCAIEWNGEALQMAQLSADFTLLEGIKWSDGEPLTARDSVFSYLTALECESQWGYCGHNGLLRSHSDLDASQRTASYEALDERTVRWVSMPGFLDPGYRKNFFIPLPEHHLSGLSSVELFEAEESAVKPLGWGPYIIEGWVSGDHIRLRKNPNYHRSDEGLPRFDQLVFTFTGENSPMNIAKILAGECDLVDQDAALDDVSSLLLEMDNQGLLQAHVVNGIAWEHLDFSLLHADYDDGYQIGNDRPDIFGDVRTRQAIAMCLDRERVINEAVYELSAFEQQYLDPGHPLYDMVFGVRDAPNTYVPKDHPLYNPDIAIYQYSPENASSLLEEVGWIDHDDDPSTPRMARSVSNVPDGTLFEFNYWTTSSNTRQRVAPILAESLAACGIKVNIQHWGPAAFFEVPESPVFTRNFDMVEFAWLSSEIPPCDLFLSENIPGNPEMYNSNGSQRFPKGWEGENNSGYSSSEYDLACKAALAALPGQPEFFKNHMLAQVIFARDLPVVPLFQRVKVTAARADICGYRMDSTANSDTWNIEEYGFGEDC